MPQTYSATGHITLRLCKLNASRTAIIKYKNQAKNPKHSCKTDLQKKYQRKHHRVSQNLTLVTDTTKDRPKYVVSSISASTKKLQYIFKI